jgi:hypothetical protein
VLALALVLFAITNLPWHLDDYDQAKQAFTSFEMVECGHWFHQHTRIGGSRRSRRWSADFAGLYAVMRSWEIAWRLPSFLAALALLVLVLRSAQVYGQVAL